MGCVSQAAKLNGKAEDIYCDRYINVSNHKINMLHQEQKELIYF